MGSRNPMQATKGCHVSGLPSRGTHGGWQTSTTAATAIANHRIPILRSGGEPVRTASASRVGLLGRTGAMGVRTRGLDIKAGAAKLKADKAARLEAELVIDRWNRHLATGRDMLWSPTMRAAAIACTPWLNVFCPGCGASRAIDLRTADRHPLAPVATMVLGLRCSWGPARRRHAELLRLLRCLPPAVAGEALSSAEDERQIPPSNPSLSCLFL